MSYAMHPVGIVRGGLPSPDSGVAWPKDAREIEGRIEVFPECARALDGLEGFSHLFVLSYLDRQREGGKGLLRVRPRRHRPSEAATEDAPEVGVFATDSRPRRIPSA